MLSLKKSKISIIYLNILCLLVVKVCGCNFYYFIDFLGLVDQDALIKALQEKRIGGAGLDVMTPEPLPLDSPLITMNNVGMYYEIFIEIYSIVYLQRLLYP